MKKHEAHKWLINLGLTQWRKQLRYAAMKAEAFTWLTSLSVQAVGREMLKARARARQILKDKASMRGLAVTRALPRLDASSVRSLIESVTDNSVASPSGGSSSGTRP